MSRSSKGKFNISSLAPRLDGHFGKCAAIAAGLTAGEALLATPDSADAAIRYSGVVNINIPSSTSGVYLNVVNGVNNPSPSLVPGWDFNPWNSSGLSMFSSTSQAGGQSAYLSLSGSGYSNLAVGTSIGPGGIFNTGVLSVNNALNLNSNNNCVGFRFIWDSSSTPPGGSPGTGTTHYGTARISLSATSGSQPRSIVDYAWEDTPNTAITACAPEPGSIALLALGAVGLVSRRRRLA